MVAFGTASTNQYPSVRAPPKRWSCRIGPADTKIKSLPGAPSRGSQRVYGGTWADDPRRGGAVKSSGRLRNWPSSSSPLSTTTVPPDRSTRSMRTSNTFAASWTNSAINSSGTRCSWSLEKYAKRTGELANTWSSSCSSSSPRRTNTKMLAARTNATSTTTTKARISLLWRLKMTLAGATMLRLHDEPVAGTPDRLDAERTRLQLLA